MIPKKLAPDVIRGGYGFSEKHALRLDRRDHAPSMKPTHPEPEASKP